MVSHSSNSRQSIIPGDQPSQRLAMAETKKGMQAVAVHRATHPPAESDVPICLLRTGRGTVAGVWSDGASPCLLCDVAGCLATNARLGTWREPACACACGESSGEDASAGAPLRTRLPKVGDARCRFGSTSAGRDADVVKLRGEHALLRGGAASTAPRAHPARSTSVPPGCCGPSANCFMVHWPPVFGRSDAEPSEVGLLRSCGAAVPGGFSSAHIGLGGLTATARSSRNPRSWRLARKARATRCICLLYTSPSPRDS